MASDFSFGWYFFGAFLVAEWSADGFYRGSLIVLTTSAFGLFLWWFLGAK